MAQTNNLSRERISPPVKNISLQDRYDQLKNQQNKLKLNKQQNLRQQYEENLKDLQNDYSPDVTSKKAKVKMISAEKEPIQNSIESIRQTFELNLNLLKKDMDQKLNNLSRREALSQNPSSDQKQQQDHSIERDHRPSFLPDDNNI